MLPLYCVNVVRTKLLPESQGYTFQLRKILFQSIIFSDICMVSSMKFQVLLAVIVLVTVCWSVTLVVLTEISISPQEPVVSIFWALEISPFSIV
jgi:hypothetical protein